MPDTPWTPGPLDIESDAGGYRVTTMDGVTIAHVKSWGDAELFRAAPEMANLLQTYVRGAETAHYPTQGQEMWARIFKDILSDITGQEVGQGESP